MNAITDYYDFFIFLGGILVFGGIIHLILQRNFKEIFISEEEIAKLKSSNPRISVKTILLIIIAAGFLLNQVLIWKVTSNNSLPTIKINITKK